MTWFWDAIAVWPWLTLCFMFLVGVVFTGAWVWLLPETRGTRVTAAEILRESP